MCKGGLLFPSGPQKKTMRGNNTSFKHSPCQGPSQSILLGYLSYSPVFCIVEERPTVSIREYKVGMISNWWCITILVAARLSGTRLTKSRVPNWPRSRSLWLPSVSPSALPFSSAVLAVLSPAPIVLRWFTARANATTWVRRWDPQVIPETAELLAKCCMSKFSSTVLAPMANSW